MISQTNVATVGNTGHGRNEGLGKNTFKHRRETCPAFQTTCDNCSRKGHFTKLCRQAKVKRDSKGEHSNEGAVHDVHDVQASTYIEMCGTSISQADHNAVELGLVSLSQKGGQILTIDAQQHDNIQGWSSKVSTQIVTQVSLFKHVSTHLTILTLDINLLTFQDLAV